MSTVHVLFFATLRERAGRKSWVVDLPEGARVSDLKARLAQEFPEIESIMATCIVAINRHYAANEDVIPAGAEVALFPPVSGGRDENLPTYCAITEEELDINAWVRRITLPTTGAACLFTGMVRGITRRGDAHETDFLEYEAYSPMAEEKMRQIAAEIRQKYPSVQGIAIVQRIGRLYPGTPTVLVACSAAHRDTGVFEAARYGIDRLKEIVPIWKKEVTPQGESWVEGDYIPSQND